MMGAGTAIAVSARTGTVRCAAVNPAKKAELATTTTRNFVIEPTSRERRYATSLARALFRSAVAIENATANDTKYDTSPSCGCSAATGPVNHDCCQNGSDAAIPASQAKSAVGLVGRAVAVPRVASSTAAHGAAHVDSSDRKFV